MKRKEKININRLNPANRLYHLDISIIGITGSIATGKSAVSNYLQSIGHNVICADQLVKQVYNDQHTIDFIKKKFSKCYVNNKINFKILREIFFNDTSAKKSIENFITPQLEHKFKKVLSSLPKKEYIFYDIPLLFEKKYQTKVDLVICVFTSKETQTSRLMLRDNISNELALKIINSQIAIEKKVKLADIIIDNNLNLDSTYQQTQTVIDRFSID